jgi:hypothetical protein
MTELVYGHEYADGEDKRDDGEKHFEHGRWT